MTRKRLLQGKEELLAFYLQASGESLFTVAQLICSKWWWCSIKLDRDHRLPPRGVKPKCLDCHLVAGCGEVCKPWLLHVGVWDMEQTKIESMSLSFLMMVFQAGLVLVRYLMLYKHCEMLWLTISTWSSAYRQDLDIQDGSFSIL